MWIDLQIPSETSWQEQEFKTVFSSSAEIGRQLPEESLCWQCCLGKFAARYSNTLISAALATSSVSHARKRSVNRGAAPSSSSPTVSSSIEEYKPCGASLGVPAQAFPESTSAIPSAPSSNPPMSLSRSPSPRPGGGWSTPGLAEVSDHGTPRQLHYSGANGSASTDLAWAAAKAKSDQVRNTPSFTTRNEGFFSRQRRKISATLPRFNSFGPNHKDWNAEKLNRGRWRPSGDGKWSRLKTLVGNVLRKFKVLIFMLVLILLMTVLWSKSSTCLCWTPSKLPG